MERTIVQPRFKDAEHFKNFWTKGNGKQLLAFSEAEVDFKDFEKFAPYFYHVDDIGDQVVKDVYLTQNTMKLRGKLKAISAMVFPKKTASPKA